MENADGTKVIATVLASTLHYLAVREPELADALADRIEKDLDSQGLGDSKLGASYAEAVRHAKSQARGPKGG